MRPPRLPPTHARPLPLPTSFFCAALLAPGALACSGQSTSHPAVQIDALPPSPSAHVDSAPRGPRSCPAGEGASTTDLTHVRVIGDVAGVTYATAERREGDKTVSVLVWLDAKGAVSTHPIARSAVLSARSGATLHLLGLSPDRSQMFVESIDVSAPDAPRTRSDDKLSIPWNSLSAFAADGEQLWISETIVQGAANEQVTFVLDRKTGRVEERKDFSLEEGSFCDGQACTLVSLDHARKTAQLTWIPHSGAPAETLPLGGYPGNYVGRSEGDGLTLFTTYTGEWLAITLDPSATPHLVRQPGVPVPGAMCGFDSEVPGPWPGVVACDERGRALLYWDSAARKLATTRLPPGSGTSELYAAFPDGPIHVGWTAGSGLRHGPEFNGVRRYSQHWYFEGGESALLTREGDQWVEKDRVPLPLSGAEGELTHGYTPSVLVRGSRAAVLLTSESALDPGYVQPIRKPCR